ncbi:MAG: hypothetical protein R3B13_02060 [Polyangiaceae bacterium]
MGRRRRLGWCLLAGLSWATPSGAQAPAPGGPDVGCPRDSGSAVSELACETARQLGGLPAGTFVVAGPLQSDVPLEGADRLSIRIGQVVAGRLSLEHAARPAALAQARGLASHRGWLLHLSPKLERGKLSVVAELHAVMRSFWDRVRAGNPGPSRHAFAERAIDAELRTFLPPVPLVARHIDRIATPEPHPVAVACGDTDGDGSQELVIVGRHRVRIGRARSGKLTELRSLAWSDLSVLSRSPLREPIASAAIRGPDAIDVGLTDRLDGVRLDASGKILARFGRKLPWGGGGCAHVVGLSVQPKIEACTPTDPPPPAASPPRAADALAGATIASPTGALRAVRAARRANESTVDLFDGSGRMAQAPRLGAQLAIADLDGDGQPELLGAADTLNPTADALIVQTWQADGTLSERFRIAVPSGVFAIGVCASESTDAMKPIVVATNGSTWIVR